MDNDFTGNRIILMIYLQFVYNLLNDFIVLKLRITIFAVLINNKHEIASCMTSPVTNKVCQWQQI